MTQQRTVRELSEEIAAELILRVRDGVDPFIQLRGQTELFDACIDLISGVLARYDGFLMVNDEGLPVDPLPPNRFDLEEESK